VQRYKHLVVPALLLSACLPLVSQNGSAVVFKNQIDDDLNTLAHSYPRDVPYAFADLRAKLAGQNHGSPFRIGVFPPQVICEYLVGHERETVGLMSRFLADRNPEVRRESILTFSCLQPAFHLPLSFLLDRLNHDRSLLVRDVAASAIGQFGNSAVKAVPQLTTVVSDTSENPELRETTLRTLAVIEDNSPNLISLLGNLVMTDPERGIQWTALQILLGRGRSTPAARFAILHFIASIHHGASAYVQAEAIRKSCWNYNDHTNDASGLSRGKR
jgi:HEAT repeat protein